MISYCQPSTVFQRVNKLLVLYQIVNIRLNHVSGTQELQDEITGKLLHWRQYFKMKNLLSYDLIYEDC